MTRPPLFDRAGLRFVASLLLFASISALVSGCTPGRARPSPKIDRALWVKRWDFLTEEQVRTAITRAAESGFDTVFFQVRGNGTVFYRSQIEPWAEEFGHRDPGFDPLAVACEEAALRGIALHAWVNALPGWRGPEPPPAELGQLYTEHPEWFLYDENLERQPLHAEYVQLNPCALDARAHIVSVIEEIVTGYDVAGIHLDYIRFMGDYSPTGKNYPQDPESLRAYEAAEGKRPSDDPARFDRWRTGCVTTLVEEIRAAMLTLDRRAILTAAVYRTPKAGLDTQQNWVRWVKEGTVDAVVPMIYTDSLEAFERDLLACSAAVSSNALIAGIGVYKQTDPTQFKRMMRIAPRCGASGVALFDYASFFDPETPCPRPRTLTELREARREQLLGR